MTEDALSCADVKESPRCGESGTEEQEQTSPHEYPPIRRYRINEVHAEQPHELRWYRVKSVLRMTGRFLICEGGKTYGLQKHTEHAGYRI